MELEAEVQKLKEQNKELERKQVTFLNFVVPDVKYATTLVHSIWRIILFVILNRKFQMVDPTFSSSLILSMFPC